MTNTEAQQVLGTMLMRHDLTDAELEAIGMAGEALEEEWIPVEKGLPENNEILLTYRPRATGRKINVETHIAGYWGGSSPYSGAVTHWRYLPKPPEVD